MSYLVLARKWRPRDFEGLVGQEHVVRALTHALTTQRLHHAWLFTGTRGVGKTTLSRILAKSLNCETGITAKPCGQCRACTEIDGGRFVDYVELDAASNRGVDEMTQLLEQAVYSPAAGRFKVYMIDEVHMLTGHAFNAMLKTLEEPPAHVKFILATTDPQKIPPTVLSRCLQFNLKQMPPEAVAGHLSMVLTEEQVPFESAALRLIGQAASGSMRDALSLTDQAIAYSGANLTQDAVRSMLGSVDQTLLVQLTRALTNAQAHEVLSIADALNARGLSFRGALGDLAIMLSRVAIYQRVGSTSDEDDSLHPEIAELAASTPADLVQLFYTVAVHGRQELVLAPDEYAGFVMVCLKMLSFAQAGPAHAPAEKKTLKSEPAQASASHRQPDVQPDVQTDVQTENPALAVFIESAPSDPPPDFAANVQVPESELHPEPEPTLISPTQPITAAAPNRVTSAFLQEWPVFAANLPLTGLAQQLATQSACQSVTDQHITLQVRTEALAKGPHVERVQQVLGEALGRAVKLTVTVGDIAQGASAQMLADERARERQQHAEDVVQNDPFVRTLIESFDAQVVPGSVRSVSPDDSSQA
jgi:DNA polymerase-3 subunit gamma/tau